MVDFKHKCEQAILAAYSNPDWLQLTSYDQGLWLFSRIYESVPIYLDLEACPEISEKKLLCDAANLPYLTYDADEKKALKNLLELYKDKLNYNDGGYFFTEDFMYLNGILLLRFVNVFDKIKDHLPKIEVKKSFGYVSAGSNGFNVKFMEVKDLCTDENFFDNYNDDFPWEKILDFCESDVSGIAILHGIPGTGKSSAIRHLISTSEAKFYWLDQSMLGNINNTSFIEFLMVHKNATFIMEDCELLLHSREQGGNGLISSLLNLSDGILGDSLHIKFLCTFNSDLRQIDKALLRKGRLKIKYELKELEVDKANILLDRLGYDKTARPLPLCDIYNYNVDNGNKVKTSKIGF